MSEKKITKREFPEDIKTKFNTFIGYKKVKLEFYDALEISHPKWNVKSIVPYKDIKNILINQKPFNAFNCKDGFHYMEYRIFRFHHQ